MEKTTTLEQVIYDVNLPKVLAREADLDFQEDLRNKQAKKMARISRILIAVRDLAGIIAKLSSGESVTITSEGELFVGRVRTEKLRRLSEVIPSRESGAFDMGMSDEATQTKWWVSGQGKVWENAWDKIRGNRCKENEHGIVGLFLMKLAETPYSDITHNIVVNPLGHSYVQFTLKGFPITVEFSTKTFTASAYIHNGIRTEI